MNRNPALTGAQGRMNGVDINSALPKYFLVKNHILEQIKSKRLEPDGMLPSEKELMEKFSVSRITVRKALDDLVMDGYIYKIQGKGTYVKQHKQSNVAFSSKLISCSDEIRAQNMIPSRKVLHQKLVPANAEIAETLSVAEGENVLWFERIYYADHIPMNYANSYISLKYLKGLENYDLEKNSMLSIVTDIYKCEVVRINRIIEAVAANSELAADLSVPEGFPLLKVSSVSNCNVRGQVLPFEINTSCYRTDIIRFSIGAC